MTGPDPGPSDLASWLLLAVLAGAIAAQLLGL